jgi:hypothetical protein
MSVRVELDGLRSAVAEQGTAPFLVTVGDDGRPRVVSVAPTWVGDQLEVPAGRHSVANVAARPVATLLWPAGGPGAFSLLVDGEAVADPDGERVLVSPTSALFHRPAESGGSDCAPIL